jgi:hypothetical protein
MLLERAKAVEAANKEAETKRVLSEAVKRATASHLQPVVIKTDVKAGSDATSATAAAVAALAKLTTASPAKTATSSVAAPTDLKVDEKAKVGDEAKAKTKADSKRAPVADVDDDDNEGTSFVVRSNYVRYNISLMIGDDEDDDENKGRARSKDETLAQKKARKQVFHFHFMIVMIFLHVITFCDVNTGGKNSACSRSSAQESIKGYV